MFLNTIYEYEIGNRRKIRLLPVLIAAVCLIIAGFGAWSYWQRDANPLPKYITKEINFPVFYPTSQSPAIVNKSSFKYDPGTKVLSFIATDAGQSITLTEQATPESFVDVPQVYTTLVDSLNNYSSFDSLQGQVNLTYPKQFNNMQQSAVINAKGILMFAHDTSRGLSNSQWQKFFNNLTVIQ